MGDNQYSRVDQVDEEFARARDGVDEIVVNYHQWRPIGYEVRIPPLMVFERITQPRSADDVARFV